VEEHQIHPFPSRGEKDAFKKLYGIENDPQLDGFLCRARKKYKKKMDESKSRLEAMNQGQSVLSLSSGGAISTVAAVSETSTTTTTAAAAAATDNNTTV